MGSTADRLPRGVWLSAAGSVALLLAVAGRYGFHRDELYFVVAGRNLDWGYVDQPPFAPLVARVSELVGGTSATSLRVLPALAVGLVALLSASMARRFGGSRSAQVFAAFSTGFLGVLLGEGHLLSTAVFDFALWTVGLWIVVGLLDGDDPSRWLWLGVVVGLGMQNKYLVGFFAIALMAGLVLTKNRHLLKSWHPWAGGAVALLIALPNLIWQAANDWPQLEMAEALRDRSDGPLAFLVLQPALLSVALAIPAFAGLRWLFVSARWRPLALAYLGLVLLFLTTGGKAYYVAPMYSVLLAAGAVWFEGLPARGRNAMAGAAVAGIGVGLFVALPLLPIESAGALDATGELGETVGWPELIDHVSEAYETIPTDQQPSTVIFTSSYGEAAAVDVLGAEIGLPAASSGHNNYWLWGPPDEHGPIIGVGHVEAVLNPICPDLTMVATLGNPYDVENEVAGQPLWLCLEPSRQLADVWESVRHYS